MPKQNLSRIAHALTPFLLLGMLFLGGIYYVLLAKMDQEIRQDAAFAASNWSNYLMDHPSEVGRLESGVGLSEGATNYYRVYAQLEKIVGFALIDANGDVAFKTLSSPPTRPLISGEGSSRTPFVVTDLPLSIHGERLGLEVLSDETLRQSQFGQNLLHALAALAFLTAASFGVPAFVFLRQLALKDRGEQRMEFMAQHDLMTSLMNRSSFNTLLDLTIQKLGADEQIALHVIDLDRFKSVNESFGHHTGDELIKSVAIRLQTVLGPLDFAARFGGDEFVMVQLGIKGPEDAVARAAAIRLALNKPLTAGDHQVTTTLSVGVALAPRDGNSATALTKAADLALYQAKADGRDTWRMYEPQMDAVLQERRKIEKAVRHAVSIDGFELHYQPIVLAVGEKLLGFEVLLRLKTEAGESLAPTKFIPIAEELGLISRIGAWVIRTACLAAATWPDNLTVAVNMSPRQFENDELCGVVAAALKESGLDPSRLELEITEGLLMSDTDSVMRQLVQLKALGVSIAMDDFGTGYSSLSYLWRFPFDKLKIDRSFMQVLAEGGENVSSILNTIVTLGRALNLKVTAEGVETEQQAAWLKEIDCDQLQGYRFGQPTPECDLPTIILKRAQIQLNSKPDTARTKIAVTGA